MPTTKPNPVTDNIGRIDALQDLEDLFNSFILTPGDEPESPSVLNRVLRAHPITAASPLAGATSPDASFPFELPEDITEEEGVAIRDMARGFASESLSLEDVEENLTRMADSLFVRRENEASGADGFRGVTGATRAFRRGYYNTRATGQSNITRELEGAVLFGQSVDDIGNGITDVIDERIRESKIAQDPLSPFRTPPTSSREQETLSMFNKGDPLGPFINDSTLLSELVKAREEGDDDKFNGLLQEAIDNVVKVRENSVKKIVEKNNKRLEYVRKANDIVLPAEVRLLQQAHTKGEALEVWNNFPITTALAVAAESATESGLTIGAYAAANIMASLLTRSKTVGDIAGTATAFNVAATREFNRAFMEQAEKRGFNLSEEEDFKRLLDSPATMMEMEDIAKKRGTVSGAVASSQIFMSTKRLSPRRLRGTMSGEALNLFTQFVVGIAGDTSEAYLNQIIGADSSEEVSAGPVVAAAAGNIGSTVPSVVAGRSTSAVSDLIIETRSRRGDSDVENALSNLNRAIEEATNSINQRSERTKATVEDVLGSATEGSIEGALELMAQRVIEGDTQLGGLDSILETVATVPEGLEPVIDSEVAAMTRDTSGALDATRELLVAETSNRERILNELDGMLDGVQPMLEALDSDRIGANDLDALNDALAEIDGLREDITDVSDLTSVERSISESLGVSGSIYSSQKVTGIIRALNNVTNDRSLVVQAEGNSAVSVNLREPSPDLVRGPTPELEALANDMVDTTIPLSERLKQVQDAFDRGVLTERFATDTLGTDLLQAIVDNDLAAMTDAMRFHRPPTLERMKEALRTGDVSALNRLVGIDGQSIARGKGITGRNQRVDGPTNLFSEIVFELDKLKRAAATKLAQITRASGARGPAARAVNQLFLAHRKYLEANKAEIENHLDKTATLFPNSLDQGQLDVINEYMNKPNDDTAAALEAIDPTNGRWKEVLDERAAIKDKLTAFMVDEGIAHGAFKEALVKNTGAGWHTDYAVFLGQDVYENLTPEVKRKFLSVLATRLRDPIANSKLGDLNKSQLMELASQYDIIRSPKLDKDGNPQQFINGIPLNKVTKNDIIKALQDATPLTDDQLSTIMHRLVNRASSMIRDRISNEGIVGREETEVGSRQESIHKKKVLDLAEDELSKVLVEVYGKIQHPNVIFTRTTMALIKEIADYSAARDAIQFAVDIGAATVGIDSLGLSVPLADNDGMSALQSSFPIKHMGPDGVTVTDMVSPGDVFVADEIANLFQQHFKESPKANNVLHRSADLYAAFMGLTKYSLVVANLPAIPRNMIGGLWIATRNGHFGLGDFRSTIKAFKEFAKDTIALGMGKDSNVPMLTKLGMLRDSARAGVLNDHIGDMSRGLELLGMGENKSADTQFRKAMDKLFSKVGRSFTELHRATDEIIKVMGFYEERAFLAEAMFPEDRVDSVPISKLLRKNKFIGEVVTPEMLADEGITPTADNIRKANVALRSINENAANVISSITPTFSKTTPFIRAMRLFPILGPFPAFASEAIRSQFNSYRYLGALSRAASTGRMGDVQLTPEGRKAVQVMAVKKGIGAALDAASRELTRVATGFTLGHVYGAENYEELLEWGKKTGLAGEDSPISARMGLSRMLERSAERLLPDFLRDNNIAVVDFNPTSGNMMIVDTSYMDPVGHVRQGFYTSLKMFLGEDRDSVEMDSKVWRSFWSFMSPMLGVEPGLDNLIEATINGEGWGPSERATRTMKEIASSVMPPFLENTKNLINEKKPGQLAAYLGGVKLYEVNTFELFRSKMAFGNMTLRENKRAHIDSIFDLSAGLDTTAGKDYETIKKEYIRFRSRERTFSNGLVDAMEAMKDLGHDDAYIIESVTKGMVLYNDGSVVLSNEMLDDLLGGTPPSIPLQGDEVDSYINKLERTSSTSVSSKRIEELYRIDRIIRAIDSEFMSLGTIDGEEPF